MNGRGEEGTDPQRGKSHLTTIPSIPVLALQKHGTQSKLSRHQEGAPITFFSDGNSCCDDTRADASRAYQAQVHEHAFTETVDSLTTHENPSCNVSFFPATLSGTRSPPCYTAVEGLNGITPSTDGSNSVPLYHSSSIAEEYDRPMWQLAQHINGVFRNQRRASPHVMTARPSPCFMATNGIPPPLPPLQIVQFQECPVYAAYGFCPYSTICFLPHKKETPPLVVRAGSADKELQRLSEKFTCERDEPLWTCAVCGYNEISEYDISPVGETFFSRCCPKCSLMCYFPYVTYLIESIMENVGDDYQLFKTEVDRYRGLLPDVFKIPCTFEAHRIASVGFGWSLVSPKDVKDAVEAAHREMPEMECIISMGSGVGYIEHIFNRVVNGVGPYPRDVNRSLYPSSSFDGVQAHLQGRSALPIYAFDELCLRCTYSVNVSIGGPLTVLSMKCRRCVLLLSWPPFGSPQEEQSSMGFETLEYFTQCGGELLIYIGDVASTGDWRFHKLLETHYKLIRDYPVRRELRRWLPQQMGLVYAGNDTIGVYRRRPVPFSFSSH